MTDVATSRAYADAIRTHADATLIMLRNLGARGANYDLVVMRSYQSAFNAALPAYKASPEIAAFAKLLPLAPLAVDADWGLRTSRSVFALLQPFIANLAQPSEFAAFFPAWWQRNSVRVTEILGIISANMTARIQALVNPALAAEATTGAEAVDTAQDTGSAVSTTTARQVDTGSGQASPPPGTPPGGTAPIAQTAPAGTVNTHYRPSAEVVRGNTPLPTWIFWGLGIFAFAGVIGWAAWRKTKRRSASTGNRA